jgi:hypothetical protein
LTGGTLWKFISSGSLEELAVSQSFGPQENLDRAKVEMGEMEMPVKNLLLGFGQVLIRFVGHAKVDLNIAGQVVLPSADRQVGSLVEGARDLSKCIRSANFLVRL